MVVVYCFITFVCCSLFDCYVIAMMLLCGFCLLVV